MDTLLSVQTPPSEPPADPRVNPLTPRQLKAVEHVFECQLTKTWKQIAEELEVNPATLLVWRKSPAFQQELKQRGRDLLGYGLPGTYRKLIEKAHGGDMQAIKEHLRLAGEYQEVELKEAFGSWLTMLSKAGIPAARTFAQALITSSRSVETKAGSGTGVQDAEVIEDGATDDDPLAL